MVDGLDVVARLADHQANLSPGERGGGAVLLALPTPRILTALLGARVAALRASWIAAWAERLGGGDGPLPVVDLDADRRRLGALLAELAGGGVERLLLLGARDRPAFAREVSCRWPGGLGVAGAPDLAPDLSAALHDGAPPLAPGVVLVGLDGDDLPRGDARVYARDPARLAGDAHGFLPPAALFATERGDRLREAWRAHWEARGFGADVRAAALGLDAELEARLHDPAAASPPPKRARLFAVTGLDGAGKSTQAAALRDALRASGRSACVVKLYRQGAFLALADELSARTRRGAPLAAFRVSRVVKLVDSLRVYRDVLHPALAAHDAVVANRYVETHVAAAASQLGWDVSAHPLLAIFPPAARTFWLRLAPEEALRRLRARGERLSADEHAAGLAGYAAAFAELARGPCDVVLDALAPEAANAERIAAEALAGLPPPGRARPLGPVAAATGAAARATRIAVTVGKSEPGSDVVALSAVLRESLGAAAAALPASFWIEAQATQAVLDARTSGAAVSAVPLWPEALARMPLCRDLVVLDELGRLLEREVRVVAWRPLAPDDALAALIAPAAAGRRRFVDAYNAALAAVAAERGWRAAAAVAVE